MVTEHTLLKLLSDGHFHSGTELGKKLGISRSAIWKHIQLLQTDYGLEVQAVQGRGYRISPAIELLDEDTIVAGLNPQVRALLSSLEVHMSLESTNHYLMQRTLEQNGQARVVLAEMQTAGRGRRGRVWSSPFARNIYLSLLWRFESSTPNLSGLSLAVGVAVVTALQKLGIDELKLKWPNDIYWRGRKLGGILLELQGEAGGPCTVVTGLGLNVNMSDDRQVDIDQAWVDIKTITSKSLSRNLIVTHLLSQLLPAMSRYAQQGLLPFMAQWREYDMLRDQPVTLLLPQQQRAGIARGINELGALQFESEGKIESIFAGEVSLRLR